MPKPMAIAINTKVKGLEKAASSCFHTGFFALLTGLSLQQADDLLKKHLFRFPAATVLTTASFHDRSPLSSSLSYRI
jgi:hypothetical protein